MKEIDVKKIETKENELLLATEGKYTFIEKQYKTGENEMVYSHYIIKKGDKPIFIFQVPKPFGEMHPVGTDVFLRYQETTRGIMREIFNILSGKQEVIEGHYRITDPQSLEVKEAGIVSTIFIKDTDFQVGAVSIGKDSTKLATNFVDSFATDSLKYDWSEIKCEQ